MVKIELEVKPYERGPDYAAHLRALSRYLSEAAAICGGEGVPNVPIEAKGMWFSEAMPKTVAPTTDAGDGAPPATEVPPNAVRAAWDSEAVAAAMRGESAATKVTPSSATPVSAAVAPDAERDSAGTPYDERIHNGNRAKNADGTWRRRRNTPDAVFDGVMEEITRATVDTHAAATDVQQSIAPATPVASSVPPPPPFDTGVTFDQLVDAVMGAVGARTLTMAQVVAACEAQGFPTMPRLVGHPEAIQAVFDTLFEPVEDSDD